MDDNQVNIYVYDENDQPVDLYAVPINGSGWRIAFGSAVVSEGEDYDSVPYLDLNDVASNQFNIHLKSDRHRTTPVAIAYTNAGYETGLPIADVWPAGIAIIKVNKGTTQSANISVHGEYAIPNELNFFFPVRITTPAGYVIDLLLGQNGTGAGFWMQMATLAEAEANLIQSGLDAEEDPLASLEEGAEFVLDILSLIGENPWYLTVLGNKEWPVAVIPKIQIAGNTCSGVMGVGATTAGKKQVSCFYHNSRDNQGDYTFNLKVYNETAA